MIAIRIQHQRSILGSIIATAKKRGFAHLYAFFKKIDITYWHTANRKLPTSWAEAKPKHAVAFIRLLASGAVPGAAFGNYPTQLRMLFLRALIRVAGKDYYELGDIHINTLLQQIAPFFDQPCTAPVIKKFKFYGTKYHLPAATMDYSSMLEFAVAENFYMQIQEGIDVQENMEKLAAVLCRPGRKFWFIQKYFPKSHKGDRRQQYNDVTLLTRVAAFKELPNEYLWWAYFFYWNTRNEFKTLYPEVFTDQSPEEENTEQSKTAKYAWFGILHSLADKGAFGDWQTVAAENMHVVLHYLNFQHDMLAEIKANQRKEKNKNGRV